MEPYKEILIHMLAKEEIQIIFPHLQIAADQIAEMECYKALQKIKTVIRDDSLEDAECFMKIEGIINALEEIGSNGGNRHDFG